MTHAREHNKANGGVARERAGEDRSHGHELNPREMLRRGGLRVTAMRVEILRMLAASRAAMSAADVLDALQRGAGPKKSGAGRGGGVDRVTVYRTLGALVEANLAHRIDAGDRVYRYSLTDHARCDGEHHDHEHPHMICERCGLVECIEDAEVVVRSRGGSKGGGSGGLSRFRVTRQEITLRGTCERCLAQGR